MATINPAHDRHHAREAYPRKTHARHRVAQLNAAGFKAYTVDMGRTVPRAERYAVLISEGKRPDLAKLPKPAGGAR